MLQNLHIPQAKFNRNRKKCSFSASDFSTFVPKSCCFLKKGLHLNLLPTYFLHLLIVAALKFPIFPKFLITLPKKLGFCPNIPLSLLKKLSFCPNFGSLGGNCSPVPPARKLCARPIFHCANDLKALRIVHVKRNTGLVFIPKAFLYVAANLALRLEKNSFTTTFFLAAMFWN